MSEKQLWRCLFFRPAFPLLLGGLSPLSYTAAVTRDKLSVLSLAVMVGANMLRMADDRLMLMATRL